MLVFEQKIVTRLYRIKVFMQEGRPKKSAFSIERHYNVGSKMMKKMTFSRSDILKPTTVTPLFCYIF